MENVGKVRLNLDDYEGRDLYSDGDIEEELLEIVQNYAPEQYQDVILERRSWPVLYHLSEQRENILNWYPFREQASVLEVGAGCGAVTGSLLDKVEKVTAIELSKRRSMINAERHRDSENLEIKVGNFNDVEQHLTQKYDYVTLIGVFEYAQLYMGCDSPYITFLDKINKHLKDDGKILIAIENRLGMKYFAGCKEDHVGICFEGIEDYPQTEGVRTFSRQELKRMFQNAGYKNMKFYYPYPDYKFPTTIYSDAFLPKKGELLNNIRNFDGDRWVLFDESRAFDGILSAGLFPEFSNSFFVELEKKAD
jgi:2-polyprenyl-3-methyl-5-hydroxy-6-metoxy-1,4-benzoquinol methylase